MSNIFDFPPPPFERLFREPFPFIECEEAPEFVAGWRQEDRGAHEQRFKVRRLGREPGEFEFANGYERLPDICLYSLKDVPMYYSLSFSKIGAVFPPSLRYRQPEGVRGFSLPRPINPRPLGGGYFAYLTRPSATEVFYVEEPALPFYTFPEYGHYLLESLPTLHFLPYKPGMKLILHPDTTRIPEWLVKMVAPFGLGEKDFIVSVWEG